MIRTPQLIPANIDRALVPEKTIALLGDSSGRDVYVQRPQLSVRLQRALEIRVDALEQDQAADMREFNHLYTRSDEILLRIAERQQRLRSFREILLVRGAA
jgi:hypothetical protein